MKDNASQSDMLCTALMILALIAFVALGIETSVRERIGKLDARVKALESQPETKP